MISSDTVTPIIRVYYSFYHLWSARHFAKLAIDIENSSISRPRFDIEHRAYVTNSVFSSIAFLEAAINEFLKDVADRDGSYTESINEASRSCLIGIWEQDSHTYTLEKYQKVLQCCHKKQFNKGNRPYQDVDLAIKVRNELMHYKPRSYSGDTQHQLVQKLAGKFPDNPLTVETCNPYFPDKCLGSGCSYWVGSMSLF